MKDWQAQAWLAAIVDSSDDAIVGKRLDSTVVSWNTAATRIFGYTADEMIGESILRLFPPELKDEEKAIIDKIKRGERVEHFETVRVRKDGTRIDISVSVSPIRDETGEIVGAAKIARDITDAKRIREKLAHLNEQLQEQAIALEQQLDESETMARELEESNLQLGEAVETAKRAQADAEAANRVKSDFLAMMSHELRTPLNAITGYADLMEAGVHGELAAQYREYLDRIRRSQRHLLDLINGLLDYSKLEGGRLRFEISEVLVSDLLARLEQMCTTQALDKNIRFQIRQPTDGIKVKADPERALQILLNLAANAIKFTPQGGNVTVDVDVAKREAASIRVRDTGPGIAPANMERIFEPFVQIDTSLTRRNQGSGLGLAISRDLARAMDGEVTATSTPQRGSEFVLTLPRAT